MEGSEGEAAVKPLERKLLPVPELLRRIEEAAAAAAAREAEAKRAPIRARHRMLCAQRGLPPPPEGDSDQEDRALQALDAERIDLLSLLEPATLSLLKQEFLSQRHRALGLDEFVRVMRRYLPQHILASMGLCTDQSLASNLVSFFENVDVNGDGAMEFQEFTNFITEAGMAASNSGAGGEGSGQGGGGDGSLAVMDEYRKSSLVDTHPWSHPIDRLFYFEPLDHLVVLQNSLSRFEVFRAKKMNHLATVTGHKGDVLAAEYIDKFGWVCTGGNDRTIRMWDACGTGTGDGTGSTPYRPVRSLQINLDAAPTALRWSKTQNMLFQATDQKAIKAWRIEKSSTGGGAGGGATAKDLASSSLANTTGSFVGSQTASNKLSSYTSECVSTFSGQSDLTLDLLVLDNMSSLASASMDTTIAMFDVGTFQRTSLLKGHKHGVFQMAYSSEYHVLVSAAYEHSAIVWNPYVRTRICALKGHYAPLVGVQTLGSSLSGGSSSPQILTADTQGIIKIWDIRNFGCVQTLYVEDERDQGSRVEEIAAFVSVPQHKRLISAAPKRLHVHDSITSSAFLAPHLADLAPTSRVVYNTATGCFISASGASIKVWNGANGCLERVYRNCVPEGAEISALALDDAQKKFILGDTLGSIRILNGLTGQLIKSVSVPACREITALEYVPGVKNLLATAWDGSVTLWDENPPEGIPMIKRLKNGVSAAPGAQASGSDGTATGAVLQRSAGGSEIITTAYSPSLTLFATGASSGLIQLYDYLSHVLVGELPGHASEVTALVFLDPYPLLASADNEGNICIWVVRPLVINIGKCVLRLVNTIKGKPAAPAASVEEKSKEGSGSKRIVKSAAAEEVVPVTALAFWSSIDARSYLASYHGDRDAAPLPPSTGEDAPTALLYAGDVTGVIRCWDLQGAIARWGLLPFYTHDRLRPTGSSAGRGSGDDNANGAVDAEDDPYALTESEKRRAAKQIQALGLAAGGESGGSTLLRRASMNNIPSPEEPAAAIADPLGFVPPAAGRPALPAVVSALVTKNLAHYSVRAAAVTKMLETGASYGEASVEYEAALATVPGATASHWAARKAQQQREAAAAARAQAAAREAAAIKEAKEKAEMFAASGGFGSGAAASASSAPVALKRTASMAAILAVVASEEKDNAAAEEIAAAAAKGRASLVRKASIDESVNAAAAAAVASEAARIASPRGIVGGGGASNVAAGAAGSSPFSRTLSTKQSSLASATRPTVSHNFARGSAKLLASPRNAAEGSKTEAGQSHSGHNGARSIPPMPGTVAEDDFSLVGSPGGVSSLLNFPSIPPLQLSALLASANGAGLGSSSAAAAAHAALFSSAGLMAKTVLRHARANDYVEYRRVHRSLMNELERHARARSTMLKPGDIKLVHWWVAHADAIRDMRLIREEPFVHKDPASTAPTTPSSARAFPLHPRSEALQSCSFDKKVCLWDRRGQSLGHLQQGRTEDTTYQLAAAAVAAGSMGSDTARASAALASSASGSAAARSPAGVLSLKPDWTFHSDVRGRYERAQNTARRVLQRLEHNGGGGGRDSRTPGSSVRPRQGAAASAARSDLDDLDGLDSDESDSAADSDPFFLTQQDGPPLGEPALSSRSTNAAAASVTAALSSAASRGRRTATSSLGKGAPSLQGLEGMPPHLSRLVSTRRRQRPWPTQQPQQQQPLPTPQLG